VLTASSGEVGLRVAAERRPEAMIVDGVTADAPAEVAVEAALEHLRRTGRWLLIYDNAEQPEVIQPLLPAGPGRVLITTRRAGYSGIASIVDLDTLDRVEAVALLHRRLSGITDEQADRLAELLGDLPLALEQAAAYLRTTGLPVGDYLRLLRTRLADVAERGSVAGRRETLATLWDLSYQRISAERPAAMQLLRLCAWLAPENIPLDLFTNHPDQLPEPLRQAAADPLDLADTVGALVDYSLVRRTEHHLTLHRLIQATTRHLPAGAPAAGAGEPFDPPDTVLRLLRRNLPVRVVGHAEDWPRWALLLPHVLTAVGHFDNARPVASGAVSWLLDGAGRYLQSQGQAGRAEPLLRRALAIDEAALGPDASDVATILIGLSRVLQDLGRPDESLPYAERAAAIYETAYRPDHPHVATALTYVAFGLRRLDRPAEAQSVLQRALTIFETAHGPHHPDVAAALISLTSVLRTLGRPADALALAERALAIDETAYGPEHPNVAADLINLAVVLRTLGRPADALPLIQRGLAIDEAVYGPDHPEVATDLAILAVVLHSQGRPADGLPLAERALAIYEDVYGPDHPEVAGTLINIAGMLDDLGRRADAQDLLDRAAAVRRRQAPETS
jgi:tetratricopeptide (TPR) repeat protein